MPSGVTIALRNRPVFKPQVPTPPMSPPPPVLPPFFIGVCQQADVYPWPTNPAIQIDNFKRWRDRGCNLLVEYPTGDSWTLDRLKQWRDAARKYGFYRMHGPIDDTDKPDVLFVAATLPDEPDRTGVDGIPYKSGDVFAMAKTLAAAGFQVACNFDGSRVTGLQKNADPDPTWADADYASVCSALAYPSCDVYPVAGWNLNVPLDYPAFAYDKLYELAGKKPGLLYVETGDQHAPWLGTASRGPTACEFRHQMLHALNRKKNGTLRGIVYFPLQPFNGFAWDTTPPEIEVEMMRFAPLLLA